MSITVYGLQTGNGGPYYSSGDITAIASGNPAVGANIFGFVTGMGVAKFFANSYGVQSYGQVAVPTLATPNTVPIGATQIGTSAIWQVASSYPFGINTASATGQLYFAVTPVAGSPDVGSPQEFLVDIYTIFFVVTGSYEFA